MKAVLALIENDEGRLLLLQEVEGFPTFPRFTLEDSQSPLRVVKRLMPEQLGLEVSGWAELAVLTEGKHQMCGYKAHVSGGKLKHFPLQDYISASWVSPRLAYEILGGTASKLFLQKRYPLLCA